MTCRNFSSVSGRSSGATLNCRRASIRAFATAGGAETEPASPTPVAPVGLRGHGVTVRSISHTGNYSARGAASSIREQVRSCPVVLIDHALPERLASSLDRPADELPFDKQRTDDVAAVIRRDEPLARNATYTGASED